MIVLCPTVTPRTSVMALPGPGVPSNGTPRSRARGLSAARAAEAAKRHTARNADTLRFMRESLPPAGFRRRISPSDPRAVSRRPAGVVDRPGDERRDLRLRADRAQSLSPAARARGRRGSERSATWRAGRPRLPAALRHAARSIHRGRGRRGRAAPRRRRAAFRCSRARSSRPSRAGATSASTPCSRRPRAGARARRSRRTWRPGRGASSSSRRRSRSRTSPSSWASTTTGDRARAPHRLQRLVDRALPRADRSRSCDDAFGIRRALFTTVHAYTNAHRLADVPAEDKRRGRAAAENIIPQASRSPGDAARPAARARRDAHGLRDERAGLRTARSSTSSCWHEKPVHAGRDQRGRPSRPRSRAGRTSLDYEDEPIVSSRRRRAPVSAIFDSLATMMLGDRVSKTLTWYDNGWGYAHRAVDLVERWSRCWRGQRDARARRASTASAASAASVFRILAERDGRRGRRRSTTSPTTTTWPTS